ncbi:MAG: GTPase HflX [Oscillospiraceae bacterium]|nr:GTPase HflX [Oscillospiraceae bacterium]MDY3937031.1 GTPase HflX [Oscillospiraceae bacterium]
MTDFHHNSDEKERCILVSVDTGYFDAELSICELEQLAETAGAEIYGKMIQKRDKPENTTYIGEGKLYELRDMCKSAEIDLLIFDGELTPSQQRNIEYFTDVRTIDRTTLILDIFALNARTGEGKLQVELAQLKYMLPRLSGKGTSMSRLGGGIGTRGPGESKLESDRRHIRRRIKSLENALDNVVKRRALLHKRREKTGVTTVAIVGYTNAGKSTLLNALTDAGVLTENKLFATLDPTSRALKLPDGRSVILVDTVGFISRLPHSLVESFKSTLEEVVYADLILNVCDASNPDYEQQIEVTLDTIKELGASDKPVLTVFNKCDLTPNLHFFSVDRNTVRISAKTGEGLPALLEKTASMLENTRRRVKLIIPYSDGNLTSRIRNEGELISEEYTPDGIMIDAVLDSGFLNLVKDYIIHDNTHNDE